MDRSGARVSVVWSRSGKTAALAVMARRQYAGMGLSEDQARSFGTFLSEGPEPGAELELQDLEAEGAQVEAVWNPAGTKLTITLKPATPWWKGALPQAVLMPDEVVTLGRFLLPGSPGPV